MFAWLFVCVCCCCGFVCVTKNIHSTGPDNDVYKLVRYVRRYVLQSHGKTTLFLLQYDDDDDRDDDGDAYLLPL